MRVTAATVCEMDFRGNESRNSKETLRRGVKFHHNDNNITMLLANRYFFRPTSAAIDIDFE